MSVWRKTERRALPISIDPYGITARPSYGNYSGEIVDETSAFASSAVLASVSLIADSIASMPLELVRNVDGRIQKLATPSVFEKPNTHQTMYQFIHQACAMIALHGVDYIYAPIGSNGLPVEMRNLSPKFVLLSMEDDDIVYTYNKTKLTRLQVRQVSWLVLPDRLTPISPLEAQRNTIGMSIAMDRFLAQFYGEGATPSSVLETDQSMSKDAAEVLRDTWEDAHYKRRRPAVLTNGLKWKPVTTSAADMQMLEHREAIVRDIARTYRVPLHLINGTGGDSQTYQNIESAGINFVRYTLLPYMRRLEDSLSEMLPYGERVRFNADEFQRADLITRVNAQQSMIMSGTLTPNEARAMENREPYEGGDQFVLGLAGSPVAGIEGGDLPTIGTDKEPPL
jgi:HK97 family phage portal protein